jgi:hypothetical protein
LALAHLLFKLSTLNRNPPLYLVAHIDVTNTDGYMKEYGPLIRASIKEAGGRLVSLTVRGGTEQRSRFVIVKTAAGL